MANIKNKGTIGILTGGGDVPGLNPAINRIIEIAVLYEDLSFDPKEKEGKDVFHEYVKYDEYPDDFDKITEITGLTKESLAANSEGLAFALSIFKGKF